MARSKGEAVHTANIADYQIFAAAKRETRDFILAIVDDTWVRKLREPITFYTAVEPSEILDHLQKLCGGLHALDVFVLQN